MRTRSLTSGEAAPYGIRAPRQSEAPHGRVAYATNGMTWPLGVSVDLINVTKGHRREQRTTTKTDHNAFCDMLEIGHERYLIKTMININKHTEDKNSKVNASQILLMHESDGYCGNITKFRR